MAYSTTLVSRRTWTLICPGYSSSFSMRLASSRVFRRCRHRYDFLLPPAFEPVLAEVHRRSREPGAFMPLIFKDDLDRHGADKHVFGAILCVLRIFHKRVTDAIDRLHMPPVKCLEIFACMQKRLRHASHHLSFIRRSQPICRVRTVNDDKKNMKRVSVKRKEPDA